MGQRGSEFRDSSGRGDTMERIWYTIIDKNDKEEETDDFEKAREAFRKRKIVRVIQETIIYTEDSRILINVVSDMKDPKPRKK